MRITQIDTLPPDPSLHPRGMFADGRGSVQSARPNMKTVASVGDKPLPIVSGEPGASLRADTEELDLPATVGLADFGPGL